MGISQTGGVWHFANGRKVASGLWCPNEPNSGSTACGMLRYVTSPGFVPCNFRVSDTSCTYLGLALCQISPVMLRFWVLVSLFYVTWTRRVNITRLVSVERTSWKLTISGKWLEIEKQIPLGRLYYKCKSFHYLINCMYCSWWGPLCFDITKDH